MKGKQSLQRIPVDRLVAHDRNRALNQNRVDEIANSIQQVGLLTPLIVTEHLTDFNRYLLLAGHHRAAAARQLGMSQVLCTVRHGLDEDTDAQLIIMLIDNCQRQEMAAMDRAELFGVLRRGGLTLDQIAERSGFSPGWVSESLSLLELDADTQDRVRAGEVGVGVAKAAVRQVRRAAQIGAAVGDAPRPKPRKVTVEAAWLSRRHVLARKVTELCTHKTRPSVGQVGCGQCWEQAIRTDESTPDEAMG